jgi:hypothetical protein
VAFANVPAGLNGWRTIDVVDHCYQFLSKIFDDAIGEAIIETLKKNDLVPKWDDPERIS